MDMQKRWRHRLENMMQYVIKKSEGMGALPFLFREKMCKAGLFSFFIAVVGTYMGLQFDEAGFLILTWILAVFSFWQIFRFLKIGRTGNYEMLEAQILAIKGKHYLGRNYQVTIQDKEGKMIRIWIPKEKNFIVGKNYRFYFKKMEQIQGKTEQVKECRYEIFYGMEEIQQEER